VFPPSIKERSSIGCVSAEQNLLTREITHAVCPPGRTSEMKEDRGPAKTGKGKRKSGDNQGEDRLHKGSHSIDVSLSP
jgi:hypothetical protein